MRCAEFLALHDGSRVTVYAITSLTAVQADLVLLAAPTRLCRRSTGELVTEHEDLDVLDCVGPGEQRQLSTLSAIK